MRAIDEVFTALAQSSFRSRFRLTDKDHAYLQAKGLPTILEHAEKFIDQRLAPPNPAQDGRQTPWRGHPVFVAQHATATCCRSCLAKWHRIPAGRGLTTEEKRYIRNVIAHWLGKSR